MHKHEGYSKAQIVRIKKAFKELEKFRGCKAVEDYIKGVKLGLKA